MSPPLLFISSFTYALSVQNKKVRIPLHKTRFDYGVCDGLFHYKQSMKLKLRSSFLVDQVSQNNKKRFEISV